MVEARRDTITGMHPVIRILSFLALVTTLARANFPFLIVADGVFLVFALRHPAEIFGFTWRLVRRMRWFWLSIILLYTLMTPGGGHSLVLGPLEFSEGGLWLGFVRCLALLTVLLFFALLIHTTPAAQLQAALYWLLQPLARIGLPANRLSVRIALTLQTIHALQSHWSARAKAGSEPASWREIPGRIAGFFEDVFTRAETEPAEQVLTLETSAPGYGQWLLLLLVLAIMIPLRLYTTHYL